MMSAINQLMLAAGSSLAASILLKATLTTLLALLAAWLARGKRAAARHSIMAAAFGMLLALPIVSALAPAVRIVLAAPAPKPLPVGARTVGHNAPFATALPQAPAPAPRHELSLADLLLAGWAAGAVLFLLPVAFGLTQVRRLRRDGLPWKAGQSAADRLAFDAGLRRRVEVLLNESLSGPMACGVLHPAIVLPRDARQWSEEELERALMHELEHARRGDWAIHCVARAVCAAYWFLPLVWMAWRRLELEAERACDDAVVSRADAVAYADQLVGLAQRLSTAQRAPFLAMASRTDLGTRVRALLDSGQPRGRAGRRQVALAGAAAAALVLALSPLRMVEAQTVDTDPSTVKFHTSNGLVTVDVTVKDASGQPIEGLNANDFVVFEDGKPQHLTVFESQVVNTDAAGVTNYYLLGYYARTNYDGAYHKIEVQLKDNPTASLDYRKGYYGPKSWKPTVAPAPGAPLPPGVKPPVLLSKTEPAYSAEARKAKLQGSVVLSVEINTSGRADNIKVLRSLGQGLDQEAMQAVSQWKFEPATQYGAPVAITVTISVDFSLL